MAYQDAYFKSEIVSGGRECTERWEVIQNYLPQRGMILDVGSNLGYFSIRAALSSPDIGVVSVEAHEPRCTRQRKIIASHELDRICLIQGIITSSSSREWLSRGDWFDLTLLLSVIHWFDEPAAVVRDLSQMSAQVIAEVPDPKDEGACGQSKVKQLQEPVEWFRRVTGRTCSLIGRLNRHTSEHKSHLVLIEGPVRRQVKLSAWDPRISHDDSPEIEIDYNGNNFLNYAPGTNVTSLMKLGRLIYPKPKYWIQSATVVQERSGASLDLLAHNLLWTPHGIELLQNHKSNDPLYKWFVGGIQRVENSDTPSKQKADQLFELKFLKRCIAAWYRNETTDSTSAIYRYLPSENIRILPGQLLRKAVRSTFPESWINTAKRWLKTPKCL